MTNKKIYPFDVIIIAYMIVLTTLIFIFGRPLSLYYDELLINLSFVLIIMGIYYFLGNTNKRIVLFFRLIYPALLFTFLYRETGGLMHLIFPEFFDYQLTAFEKSVLGKYPTFWIDKNLISVWITEPLMATYFMYYPMIILYLVPIFFMKKYDLLKKSLTAISATFVLSYLLFILYPIEGPRYFFAGQYLNDITGPVFRSMVEFVQTKGSVHGGCMPSSHVAVALVINIFCLIYLRKIGIILILINIGLTIGTVYGRYHYISDVVVGILIGAGVTYLTLKLYDRFDKTDKIPPETSMKGKNYAS